MNRQITVRHGYALVLAILMSGVITMLITSVVNRVMMFNRLGSVLAEREQARMLALSGFQIVMAQLGDEPHAQEKGQKNEAARMIKKVEPIINRWQTFTFTDEKEGIDGSCNLYIACEQGKLNINQLYDFDKKQFIKTDKIDGKKIIQLIADKLPQAKKLPEVLQELFKERGRPLQDLTELFKDKSLQTMNSVFPEPESGITLFDLCTVVTDTSALQPWFLSKSVNELLGFKNQDKVEQSVLNTLFEQTKAVEQAVAWDQKWDTYLAPVYGKKYSAIMPEIRALFNQSFESPTFSVVSYGKFGNVVVKAYGILQKISDDPVCYCIKKLYWI